MHGNVIFPLPLPVHIAFGVLGTIFFIAMYANKKSFYYLLLSASMASTFLIYLCTTKLSRSILGIEELVLYVLILVFMFIDRQKVKKKEKEQQGATENEDSNS